MSNLFSTFIDILSLPVELVPLDFLIISSVCSIVILCNFHLLLFLHNNVLRKSMALNRGVVNLFLRSLILLMKNSFAILHIVLIDVIL